MSMNYQDLGQQIHKQRVAQGWTQERLAELAGVSASFVGHIERGTRKASMETVVSIANVMNVSTDYLLSASLNASVIGPVHEGLTAAQRASMKKILTIIQDNLTAWEGEGAG